MAAELSQKTIETVKATVPALEAHGLDITRAMCDRLGLRQILHPAGEAKRMKLAHTELDLREQRMIEDMLIARGPVSKSAAEIGRHRSSIYRAIFRK